MRESRTILEQSRAVAEERRQILDHELTAAKIKLEELGYERTTRVADLFAHTDRPEIHWVKSADAVIAEKKVELARQAERDAERKEFFQVIRNEREKGIEQGRREALEKVIEALKLDDYRRPGGILGNILDAYDRYPTVFQTQEKPVLAGPDKLWADINTTLESREAEKHAETVAATRKKVEEITQPKLGASLVFLYPKEGVRPIIGVDPAGFSFDEADPHLAGDDKTVEEVLAERAAARKTKPAKKSKKKEAAA